MKKVKVLLLIIFLYVSYGKLFAEVKLSKTTFQGQLAYVLENSYVRGTILPGYGGKIVSFSILKTEKEFSNINLATEGLIPKIGSFDLGKANFNSEVLSDSSEEVKLKLWYKVRREENSILAGIVVEKEFILTSDSYGFKVKLSIKNESTDTKRPGIVSTNFIGVSKYSIYPSTDGPKVFEYGKSFGAKSCDLISGWCGLIREDGAGVMFVMDYNNLGGLQTDVEKGMVKWRYERIEIPSGQQLSTEYYIVFTEGFSSYAYGSSQFIGDINFSMDKVIVRICKSFYPLPEEIELRIVVEEWFSRKELLSSSFKIEKGEFPYEKVLNLPEHLHTPILVKNFLGDGKKFPTVYEKFFPVGLEKIFPAYKLIPPLKNKVLIKPHLQKISRDKRLLIIKGLYYKYYKIEEIAKKIGIKVKDSYFKHCPYLQPSNSLTYFPKDYAELSQYQAVFLINVDAESIGDEGRTYLKWFVEDGGGLFVIGDFYVLGQSRMKGTYLEGLLPVENIKPFDLEKGDFYPICKTREAPNWLSWEDNRTTVVWRHNLQIKDEAKVWLEAGEKPFLVGANYGKGKVVVCTGTVLGVPPKGKVGFWESSDWEKVIYGIINWFFESSKEVEK